MRVPSSLSCSAVLIAAVLVGCGSEVSVAQTVDRTDPPANSEGTAFETTPTGPVVEAPSAPTSAAASSESSTQDPAAPPGNNGVGNGSDPAPKGNPPANDGAGSSPGDPGRKNDH